MKDTIAGQAVERKGLSTRSGIEIMRDLLIYARRSPDVPLPLLAEGDRYIENQKALYPPHRIP